MPHGEGMTLSLLRAALLVSVSALAGCTATVHPEVPATVGTAASGRSLEAVVDVPGPVTVETVVGADWAVPLSGLLNLEHPKAKAAGLKDRTERIHVAFHALHHPTRGLHLVDTGIERALFEDPDRAAIRGLVASVMHTSEMGRRTDTKTWIDAHGGRVAGVFLTHLHLDHVSGMRDVPAGTPVFAGPGETQERNVTNFFVGPNIDRTLEGKPPVGAWQFSPDPDGVFEGVLDVFGDQTVFALWVPGHTRGSTAYVVRSPSGPVLLTGDACHTAWGWDNGVEPGTFSEDPPRSAKSLERLRALAARHPTMEVRLGHQPRAAR